MKKKETKTVYLCVSEQFFGGGDCGFGDTPQEAWDNYRATFSGDLGDCQFYKAVKINVKHEVKEVLTEE